MNAPRGENASGGLVVKEMGTKTGTALSCELCGKVLQGRYHPAVLLCDHHDRCGGKLVLESDA